MVASVSSINQQHPISRNDGGNPVVEDAGQDMAGDDERLFQRPNAGRFLLTGAQKVLYERRTEQSIWTLFRRVSECVCGCWCASGCVRFVGYWLVREEGVFMDMEWNGHCKDSTHSEWNLIVGWKG